MSTSLEGVTLLSCNCTAKPTTVAYHKIKAHKESDTPKVYKRGKRRRRVANDREDQTHKSSLRSFKKYYRKLT
jgi:hypothetical protein